MLPESAHNTAAGLNTDFWARRMQSIERPIITPRRANLTQNRSRSLRHLGRRVQNGLRLHQATLAKLPLRSSAGPGKGVWVPATFNDIDTKNVGTFSALRSYTIGTIWFHCIRVANRT